MAKTNKTKNEAFRIHPALIAFLVMVILLIVAAVALYPAARDYYFAMREDQRLDAEYQAVLERNNKIQQRIEDLKTPEGIADKAREELGWVLDGEEAVNITGLGSTESSTALPPAVEPQSVEVPEAWWTQTLDEFFGYKPSIVQNQYNNDAIPGL
jgi:cell division protein FtsB